MTQFKNTKIQKWHFLDCFQITNGIFVAAFKSMDFAPLKNARLLELFKEQGWDAFGMGNHGQVTSSIVLSKFASKRITSWFPLRLIPTDPNFLARISRLTMPHHQSFPASKYSKVTTLFTAPPGWKFVHAFLLKDIRTKPLRPGIMAPYSRAFATA